MATTPGSNLDLNLVAFASRLLAVSETPARARVIAQAVLERFPGTTSILYLLLEGDDGLCWSACSTVGDDAQPDQTVPADAGTLGSLVHDPATAVYDGRTLAREEYAHLHIRRTLKALVCLPLVVDDALIGAIEILTFDAIPDRATLADLDPLCELAARGLKASQAYEDERNNSLNSITRLTQFYDIEKVFSSTLEMDQLLPIIGGKMREMLECAAVNIWMVQGDESLSLMHQAGDDPTTRQGMIQKAGEGIAVAVSDNGEPVLIHDPADERLVLRNQDHQEGGVESIMVTPLLDKGSLVGVVEAINRLDGAPFDEDDLFVLTSLNETASIALHNASLLLAERKVEVLEMLVTVSREITSTLNLERVLQTIVDAPQALIPYERAAIALQQGGKYKLSAVSGVTQLDPDAADIAPLNDILRWSLLSEGVVHVRQHGDDIDSDREETRAKFKSYFAASGMRAFYAIPLNDDTGRVGIMGLVSPDPDFLSPAHIEVLQVIAGQATVALRNAQMYKEVPFISVLEPMLEKKRKFMAIEKRRRVFMMIAAALLLIFLAAFPLPMRVDGDALVAALHSAQVQPEVEGVVRKVYVHEGEPVTKGQVIAELADWDFRALLAQAQAKYQTALLEMNHALSVNDGTSAGVQRVQADYWKSEVTRDQELLDKTQLRSPIDGVIATPRVENMVGRRLQYGDSFAEVVDTSRAIVDVAIDDTDASLLRAGSAVSVKLNSFPTRTFHGTVALVSPKGALLADSRVFFARVAIANQDGAIRAGMEGRGKVRVGWYPSGYVLFRSPLVWLYSRLWSWFGV
ncbi:MAG TPA: GAF domain-containing protein [Candidatus Sulfotelmatobacter sp.]|nr:GAF domain-containing protein [Candidatus Sulfotelmatobacter sp.]